MKTGTIEFWKQWKVIIRFGVVSLTQTSTTIQLLTPISLEQKHKRLWPQEASLDEINRKLLMLDDLSLHVNVVVINPKTTSLKFTQLYTIYSLYLKSRPKLAEGGHRRILCPHSP